MVRQDLINLINTANGKTTVPNTPFNLFTGSPVGVTNRGTYNSSTAYNVNDQVEMNGYTFISMANGNTTPPLSGTGTPGANWQQPWWSCYQRMRDNVKAAATGTTPPRLAEWETSVSGPWPCQNPDINYDQLTFYFADTGHGATVTISGETGGACYGKVLGMAETEWMLDPENPLGVFGGNSGTGGGGGVSYPQTQSPNDGSFPETFTAVTGPVSATGNPATDHGGQYRYRYITEVEFAVVIGGNASLPVDATFTFEVLAVQGATLTLPANGTPSLAYDATDPTTLVNIDASQWIAGCVFTNSFTGWQPTWSPDNNARYGVITYTGTINGTIAPGRYTLKVSFTGNPNNQASGQIVNNSSDGGVTITQTGGPMVWSCNTFCGIGPVMEATGTITPSFSSAVVTPGIHNSKTIYKIALPTFNGLGPPLINPVQEYYTEDMTGGGLTGAIAVQATQNGGPIWGLNESDASLTTLPFAFELIATGGASFTFNTSTPGYWTGVTPPVASIGIRDWDVMQWNKFPVTNTSPTKALSNTFLGYAAPYTGGTVTGANAEPAYSSTDAPAWVLAATSDNETLPWPKLWKSNTYYPVGFTILDSNGNFQQVTSAGRSGSTQPNWPQTLDAYTTEPIYTGSGGSDPRLAWKLIKLLRPASTWAANTNYALNQTIVDSNSNTQTCVTAGTSGSAAPAWSTTLNSTTNDGMAVWQLTKILPRLAPAVARISPPLYPVFWQNAFPTTWVADTAYAVNATVIDANRNTQTCTAAGTSGASTPAWATTIGAATVDGTVHWKLTALQTGPPLTMPYTDSSGNPIYNFGYTAGAPNGPAGPGWFIYRVALNRIPQTKTTAAPPTAPIAVTLGCVRSGAFVAFGTYNTGQIFTAMWPVFTGDALAYQASEQVDVQAEFITCGNSYSTWGTVDFPWAAAYYNDIETLLARLT